MPEHTTSARELADRLQAGAPRPALTPLIEGCACAEEVRAGLFLLNGDWKRAHQVAQRIRSPIGAHWHALVHRHEPDEANSRYWLRQVGNSPIYPALAQAAREAGQEAPLTPDGQWDPQRFTDCYAEPAHDRWTRPLDRLELRALLEHCLEHCLEPR
jgi:hypothetical protein